MKFKSRSDIFFQSILYGACLLLLYVLYVNLFLVAIELISYIMLAVLLPVIIFILGLLHGTSYELSTSFFSYKAAFLRGKIPLENIQELIVGETMWVGFKPATARNGIIIKYNKGREIYISPDSNETFVKKIIELNPQINIVDSK